MGRYLSYYSRLIPWIYYIALGQLVDEASIVKKKAGKKEPQELLNFPVVWLKQLA